MYRKLLNALTIVVLLAGFFAVGPVSANPPAPDDFPPVSGPSDEVQEVGSSGKIDLPNMEDKLRMEERQRLLEQGKYAEAAALAQEGNDRVLVLLVEFAGTDVFTWTEGVSTWDPLGIADPNEDTGTLGDCSAIITQTQVFTYTGPMHNEMPRPISEEDRSGDTIWTEDFSKEWFDSFMFKEGVVISYTREDGSVVQEDFMGQSVADFYSDLSSGAYTITGDILGWIPLPHSTFYYDADECPGARSTSDRPARGGLIDGGGSARDLLRDAADYINANPDEFPGFNWADYDLDGNGIIDRLWIVHSGFGEEDSPTLLNRTEYGEGAVWSHSSAVTPPYEVADGVAIGPYIVMPENGGIGVFAHEYAHNLGADDLYSYAGGETSAGFWTTMADDWTGFPIGFEPPSMDPWHLDRWGWLHPLVITDTEQVYEFTLGQASKYPDGEDMYRSAKIELDDGSAPLAVSPWSGDYFYWGGKVDLANASLTTAAPIAIPAAPTTATLSFDIAYGIEDEWDFLWVQYSEDGVTWPVTQTLTNANTQCAHDSGWVGALYGFPNDLCGAGLGGFYGYNPSFPDPDNETFDLASLAGKSVYVRFWYMTDWGTTYEGPFIDNVSVTVDGTEVFADGAETEGAMVAADPMLRSTGYQDFTHNFYLQWRNTHENGGYDSALGDIRWRYGEANTGLTVWYNNNFYSDNEIPNYLPDYPGFGPKGRMLVVDSHPEPYRDPYYQWVGYNNEAGNLDSRGQMRDATFTLVDTVDFVAGDAVQSPVEYEGRPAVSVFHDSLGYYPGAEYVWRAPGNTNPATAKQWVTKQWDASVVMPATKFYGIDAPGMLATSPFRYQCSQYYPGALLSCYWFPSGLGYAGGNGNPAELNAQYGWHAEVIEEAADHTWAKVRVWNSNFAVDSRLTVDKAAVRVGETAKYTLKLSNVASPAFVTACMPLDTEKVEFVSGANVIPLNECPAEEEAFTLEAMQAMATTGPAGALGFGLGSVMGNEIEALFTFELELKSADGYQPEGIQVYAGGAPIYSTVYLPMLNVLPTAAFNVETAGLKPGLPITFTNASTGTPELTYAWDFGDGETSTEASPAHTYAAPGTYLVTLTTANAYGEDMVEKFITVVGLAPTAGFTVSSESVKINEVVTFTNGSVGSGDMLYLWDFGDGTTSTEANPTHAYAAAGTYTVTLKAGNAYGTSEITLEIEVTPHTVFMPFTAK